MTGSGIDKLFLRFRRISAVLLLLGGLSACNSIETRVEQTAETFLHAYYAGDHAAAAAVSTPSLAGLLMRHDTPESLPEAVRQKMKEALSLTSFKIVSTEVDKDASRAVVHYEISAPGLCRPVSKRLKLQLEGRTAAVDGIE